MSNFIIPKEDNRYADWLANFSLSLNSLDCTVMDTPPNELYKLIFMIISKLTCLRIAVV
jgi:hypothetical protein